MSPTTFDLSLSASHVRDCLAFVGREESRPILNGVCIEPSGTLVATSGKALLAVVSPEGNTAWNPTLTGAGDRAIAHRNVIIKFPRIPAWVEVITVKDVPALSPADPIPLVAIYANRKGRSEFVTVTETWGPYPNWRAIVPRNVTSTAPVPAFDPEVLALLALPSPAGSQTVRIFASPESITGACVARWTDLPSHVAVLMPKVFRDWDATAPALPVGI